MTTSESIAAELATSIITDLTAQVQKQVSTTVSEELSKVDVNQMVLDLSAKMAESFSKGVKDQILSGVEAQAKKIDVSDMIQVAVNGHVAELLGQVSAQVQKQVTADVARKMADFDTRQMVKEYVDLTLSGSMDKLNFADWSIPGTAIDPTNLRISGDNISAGTIKLFNSTGIQDTASNTQMTILDEATVIENKLVVAEAEIKGNLIVDGDIILAGEIPCDSQFYKDVVEHSAGLLKMSMDADFFAQYADQVFKQIKTTGIDLSQLTLDGSIILKGNQLGHTVTDTNIQKLGELRTLTVNGETNIGKSLFVRNNRIGINTEEPSGALAVWDEECEFSVRKLQKNTLVLGSIRQQSVVLSANSKENITLETDGSVSIQKLNVGDVSMTSLATIPTYDAKKGIIVFNSDPEVGKPAFWTSLGNARWAAGPVLT